MDRSRVPSLRAAGSVLLRALPRLAPTSAVIAMIACLLVPLPTPLVDLLLSASLASAVLLLVASLVVRRTTDFLTFPTLLLLATLYRLALNVSTTRLVLRQADAGRVIDAFAAFVVQGDLVVGGVMFAIITIVQFVVIARGAERVAEVGARFALDALPGHQAAIDADLRAGVLSPSEASRRRARLTERSSFYGAMDGTIRFVRGDAIAGLAIIAVNLVGGVAIGMGRHGLALTDSLQIYGRLTIGDGLLSQIPALLASLAAGILVSRVDRDERDETETLPRWLDPAMPIVPAILLALLAAVPEMPRLAFLTTAVGLVTAAVLLAARVAARGPVHADARRITVHLRTADVDEPRALERALAEVRLRCTAALGIEVPPLELVLEPGKPRRRVEIRIEGRRHGGTEIERGRRGEDQVVLAAYRVVMEQATAIVDLQDVDRLVEEVRSTHPAVVRRALAAVDLVDVLSVMRGFLRERVPLPPLRHVLSVMAEHRRFRDPAERGRFSEIVREHLAAHWAHAVIEGVRRLGSPCFVRLTPDAEDELRDRLIVAEDGVQLSISPTERTAWFDAATELVVTAGDAQTLVDAPRPAADESNAAEDGASSKRRPLVIVTTPPARRAAAVLFAGMTPHVPVLSTAELAILGEPFAPRWLAPP